ncbi:tetratricopeptide repeat protein [Paracraurococcus lichenis]|uniref:Tetratricopeptide repeat protein n=1 Tax=Paracraurococcus lichenis TaxID=3064888 RepID=A0ABT9EBG4_9PROT|nr:tetratricopeptide repeat protein [Paracraurococcus sp. LOR1-02]MDO9713536.1 tetratricopeptide repeat protein [Paracraurococcus sp. LOR1-02]
MTSAQAPTAGNLQQLLAEARAARDRGDHDQAIRLCEQAELAGPGNPWPRLDRSISLRALDRLAEAEAICRAVLADHPDRMEAALGLGHIARRRGDHAAALGHFAAAAALAGPANPWPSIEQAKTLRDLGRFAEAAALYEQVLTRQPGLAEPLLGLGHVALARGDAGGAVAHFAAAEAAACPRNPWPRLDRATALRQLGRLEEAEALCDSVLADHPAQPEARLGLGLCARARGDRATAAARFREVTEMVPGLVTGWTELATELRETGDTAAARAVAERLTATAPGSVQAWLSLGRAERAAGRRTAALAAFRRAHECQPRDPYPLIDMATEFWAMQQPGETERHLKRALERAPDCLQALEQLGELARVARDLTDAEATFRRAIALRPASPWAWLGLMRTLADRGSQAEALAVLVEAETACGALPELEAARIARLRQLGHSPAALARARAASAASPRHMGLWIERFRAEKLLSAPEALAACLEAAPVVTADDRARQAQFRGQAAEEQWETEAAVAEYERALALRPEDAWILTDLVRARLLSLDLTGAREALRSLTRVTAAHARMQGRSANLSQTHFGQLLDEFALDAAAFARIAALRGQPPEAWVAPLAALLAETPDYTPAAMMLLIALRRAGLLDAPQGQPGGAAVPRRIAQFWDSGEPPGEIAALMGGWRAAHPQWGYQLFDDVAARAWLAETCGPAVLAAYRRSEEPAQKADLFRLAWLHAEGGWYIDADDRCLAPLETLAPPGTGLVLYQEDYGTVGNNVIGAAPQHPVIGCALKMAVAAVNRGDKDILWFATGPGLLTRALAMVLTGSSLTMAAWLRRIRVLTRTEMHQAVGMHCEVAYKNTERHWSRTAFAQRRERRAEVRGKAA